jgi:hypothetical protein
MEIEIWNEERGCWDHLEDVDRPYTEVDCQFLWWKWKSEEHIDVLDYCVLAVNRAKQIYAERNGSARIRLVWTPMNDVIWQNGEWCIDTNEYEFYSTEELC